MPVKKQSTQSQTKNQTKNQSQTQTKTTKKSQKANTSAPTSSPVTPLPTQTPPTTPLPESVPVSASVSVPAHGQASVPAHGQAEKKNQPKPGRTLIVKTLSGSQIDGSVFDSLDGLVSRTETKTSSSYFLTFDTIGNAIKGSKKLRNQSSDYKVKFSYYRVFFTLNGLTESSDYNEVKKNMSDFVTGETGSSVLYFKLYRKEDKYLGCGDLTVDTLNGMSGLLSKDGGKKEFTVGTKTGSLNGTFYRFNNKKGTTQNMSE